MKVKELKDALSQFDDNLDIVVIEDSFGLKYIINVANDLEYKNLSELCYLEHIIIDRDDFDLPNYYYDLVFESTRD